MTNLSTPEHFRTILEFAFGIADRGIPLSVVLVEPDGWSGERLVEERRRALDQLGADIASRSRRSDRITRSGETRFAALLVDCNRQGAMVFADRLLMAAEGFSRQVETTMSCGVATFAKGMRSVDELLSAAEAALDRARREGGNRVEVHEGGDP